MSKRHERLPRYGHPGRNGKNILILAGWLVLIVVATVVIFYALGLAVSEVRSGDAKTGLIPFFMLAAILTVAAGIAGRPERPRR